MSSSHDALGRARLSFADAAEIDEFIQVLGRFERGEIGADEWRRFRLVCGTYGQRQSGDAQMLRVKIPQGILDRDQLEALADVAERYSRGFGHITTRQNVQFHFMGLQHVELAMRRLADAGLTTREACGNSVRNITACPYAGVAADEAFDVTPYAEAMTRYLLRHPLSSTLPRKFKIAFEGCPEDHVATAINDIGWRAVLRRAGGRDERGFRVTVAGGTSILARTGQVLFEFLPATDILSVAEAIIRVFHRLGDYKHKQRNRLKFLVRELGWDRFKAEFDRELAERRASAAPPLTFDPEQPPLEGPPCSVECPPLEIADVAVRAVGGSVRGPGIVPDVAPRLVIHPTDFTRWVRTNVRAQKQSGYRLVTIATLLGDLTSAQLRLLGEFAEAFADGTVRTTSDQNLLLRWVPDERVESLHRALAAAGLARSGAGTLSDVTSCPGAESCRLAVTQSRGLGRLLAEHLRAREDLVEAVPGLDIKISGCPNGCGQHHIAGIGFQGSLRKIGGRPAPHYFVMVGGSTADGETTFGRLAGTVPARRSAEAVAKLVELYRREKREDEPATAFFKRVDLDTVKSAIGALPRLSPESAADEDFVDLGEASAFAPETLDGECSA